ncbi:DUF308 domain-containing protein [Candidatus Saccharibacteria bacterium]|nr:DUF308 domain-containing protein [Candidatus Saccharibacteria bacterium]
MSKTKELARPIEDIGGRLKGSAWMAVFESLAIALLGIFLVVWPDTAIKVIAYIAGVFFIIKGAYQIILYFMVKGQNDFFNNGLLTGVVSLLVGVAVLIMGEELATVFRIVIGIWMIYESLTRLNAAIKLHAANIDAWKSIVVLALLMLVIGIFITFYNGAVITLIGWMMIATGVIGIISDFTFMQYVNDLAKILNSSIKDE